MPYSPFVIKISHFLGLVCPLIAESYNPDWAAWVRKQGLRGDLLESYNYICCCLLKLRPKLLINSLFSGTRSSKSNIARCFYAFFEYLKYAILTEAGSLAGEKYRLMCRRGQYLPGSPGNCRLSRTVPGASSVAPWWVVKFMIRPRPICRSPLPKRAPVDHFYCPTDMIFQHWIAAPGRARSAFRKFVTVSDLNFPDQKITPFARPTMALRAAFFGTIFRRFETALHPSAGAPLTPIGAAMTIPSHFHKSLYYLVITMFYGIETNAFIDNFRNF